MAKAPHIIRPLRFVLPHVPGMRHALTMRAGLFLYDHLSARKSLPGSRPLDLRHEPAGAPLVPGLGRGFSYWDCAVDDSRLVILNAIAARRAGAHIRTRARVTALKSENGVWIATLAESGQRYAARAIVNAAGPWVGDVAKLASVQPASPVAIRLVKGSHIVVPRIAGADDAYTLQNSDGRIVFALPFEEDFTLIGTTEENVSGDPRNAAPTLEEAQYLLAVAKRFFRDPPAYKDIVWKFAGVRPLDDDGAPNASAVSRDYRLDLRSETTPPILHVVGGKITTYRKLAETALAILKPYFPKMRPGTTSTTPLPGGDLSGRPFERWFADVAREYAGFPADFLRRIARRHGTLTKDVLAGASSEKDLGENFGAGLTAREISYLKQVEWARTAEDVLWRRTKTGLHLPPDDRTRAADRIQACLDKS